MIERQFFGEISLKIDGFDTSRLAEKLCNVCKVISIYRRGDTVFLTTYGKYERKVKELVEQEHAICEIISRRGAIYTFRKYFRRWGIAAGALLAAAILFFLSNTVVKIEVKGTSDPELIGEIKGIIAEEGIKPGAYIPSLNFLRVSSVLFSHSDSVAWASIGHTGSVVTVNVNVSNPKPEQELGRIPCNIVSAHDAVITGASVKVGRLGVLIGDAVYSGQLLVSGIIESDGGSTKYVRSYADITGLYEDGARFYQKYSKDLITYGDKLYRRSFKFFDLEIPLPGEVLKPGAEYSEEAYECPVKLLDFTLPFSVKTYELTEIHRETREYSPEAALSELYRRLGNYEKTMLTGVKIISRHIEENFGEEGAELDVHYVLEGDIGKISEIFIK